jgi:hypothetical protein
MATERPDDESNVSSFAAEIFGDLWSELQTRFPGIDELPERDRIAVGSAIGKAAWRGVLRGIAQLTSEINRQSGGQVSIETWIHRDSEDAYEPDAWAERYGGEL